MFNGPFRPYEDPSTQQCLQDIMDGYFPSELQMRYPDGIPFSPCRQLHSLISLKQLILGENCLSKGHTWTHLPSALPGPKLSVEQFLNKLSKSSKHGGEVISVRDSARAAQALTPQLTRFSNSRVKTAEEAEGSAPDICTLRIKSESGEQTYIIKMLFTETIGDLRQHLAHARGGDSDSYEIISTFPQRVYTDNSRSLQECGLIPNVSLLLRRRDPSQQEGTPPAPAGPRLEATPSPPATAPSCQPPSLPPSAACCSGELDAATGHHVIGEEHNPFAASLLKPQ
uniref:UBX domain-containing protein 11 n=1 Tax=Buteo japonicus TaxID=224669 RepID=A0A8C0BQQ8_9AVES